MSEPSSWPHRAFVAGTWRETARSFRVTNPATGAPIGEVSAAGREEAEAAATAAVEAFPGWRAVDPRERARLLRALGERLLAETEPLARLMTQEMGKPIAESRGEVRYAASFLAYYADLAAHIGGESLPAPVAHKRLWVRHEPVGPVLAITPWNFPAAMVTRKLAPALAAGCTVVLKPAEQSPITALALARLFEEVGGPPGVLQVLPTDDPAAVADPLLDDPRIRKLTFTGSLEVGRRLYERAARTLKRVSLELGGNAPFLVFPDADLERAARDAVASRFRNSGQTCISTNRLLIHEAVLAPFTEAFAALTARLTVGDPLDEATQIGPLVDLAGHAKVRAVVAEALDAGARALVGGRSREGLFFDPTVLVDVAPGMRVLEDESFGPVAPIVSFATEAEALARANATSSGLAAYVWTKDLARAIRVSEGLEFGIVGVNDGVPSAMAPGLPFGGVKLSGLGREGGEPGLAAFLETKSISIGLYP